MYNVLETDVVGPSAFGICEEVWTEDLISGSGVNVDTDGLMVGYVFQGCFTIASIIKQSKSKVGTGVDTKQTVACTLFQPCSDNPEYDRLKGKKVAFRRAMKLWIAACLEDIDQWNDFEIPNVSDEQRSVLSGARDILTEKERDEVISLMSKHHGVSEDFIRAALV